MDRLWFATTKNDKSKNKHLFAGDRSIDKRVDPLQPVESLAAKVTSPLQIFTDLADCLIPAIGQPFHSWNTCLSGNQTMRILKFYFQKSLNDHEWVMTKFSSFLILKKMNNETSPFTKAWRRLRRKILGSENGGENQVSMSLLPTSKLHCKIFNKYRVGISEIHRRDSIAVSIFVDILLKLTNTVFVFVNLSTNIETRCCLNK